MSADSAAALIARAGQTEVAGSDTFAAYQSAIEALSELGVEPFMYPTAAPFCAGDGPLGLTPAMAGAVPGPWPRLDVSLPGVDLAAVEAGQVLFAFVPYGMDSETPGETGLQVAWLNLDSGRGGLTALGPMSEVLNAMVPAEVPESLRPLAEQVIANVLTAAMPIRGVRAAPVDTGSGTVLAAVFGTVDSCFFLPTVGITEVP